MMTSPFFFRRTVTTVVTVSAAFTLGAGCTDSTALDLSPLPLAAADIDAERAMVVACTADPAVRSVVGGFFPPEGLRATAADTFVKDLTVAFPRVRFPGSEVVLPPGVRGRHFTFAAGTWTGTPSPDAPPNGISIALYADAMTPGGTAVGSLVVVDSSTAAHAVAALQVRSTAGQLLFDGRLTELLADGTVSARAALPCGDETLEVTGAWYRDGRSTTRAALRSRPTSWAYEGNVLRGGNETTLRIGAHTLRRVAFSREDDWDVDSLVYWVNGRRIATTVRADSTLRRAHPDASPFISAMTRFLQESPSALSLADRVSNSLMFVLLPVP